MTSALANWYPGHRVLDLCVIVAATVAVVSAAAWSASWLFNRNPTVRHWTLLSALMASLASPFLAFGFIAAGRSFINVPLLIAEETALAPELPDEVNPSRDASVLDEPAPSVASENFLPTDGTDPAKAEAIRDDVATAESKSPTVDPATGRSDPFRSGVVAVLLMWLCGTLIVIRGLLRGALFLRRFRRSVRPTTDAELGKALDEAGRLVGARCLPAVGVSSLARAPMVAGLFRPIIVIPQSLLAAIRGQQLRDILTHEIAHVERRDNLVVLLQAIARAAFWPIAFVHLLNRELERAREEICDNHVLAYRDAVSYGETLLSVAHLAHETEMPVGTVGILHWRGKLEDRIFGLVHKRRSKMTRMHPLIAVGVLTVFLSASALLCGTTIVAAPPPPNASDKPAVAQEQPVTQQKPEKAQEKEAFTAWGKEVGGLQAGLGYKVGEKRSYHHGETVTLVVRVRNVGNEDVKFRYLKEFFMEKSPTVTGGEGKTIRQGGLTLFGRLVHISVDVNLAPGKELELHDLKLKLAPASDGGDVTEVSPGTLNGKGRFQIQYEQLAAASIDPNLTKLATAKLELEVKEAEKGEKEQKEGFTAWGKEIGGLQAGLGFKAGEKRAYSHGETVKVVLRIRNVSKEAVDFKHISEFFVENPPKIIDADGKVVKLPNYRTRDQRLHMPRSSNVAPGKEVYLYEWTFALQPHRENSSRSFIHGTGKHSLQCERIVGPTWLNPDHPNPTLNELTTGKLELEIKSETPAAAESDRQAGEGQGGEAAPDSGAEKLYRAMEKKVSDAKSLRVALVGEMDSQAIKGTVKATIYATQGNKSRMEIDFELGGNSNKQLFISDGKARYTKQGDTGTLDANLKKGPEEGKLIARIGITGTMVMARAVKPGEEAPEFDLDKDAPVTTFKLGDKEKVGDSTAQVVTYQLDFNGKSAQISVWIDTKTQLPLKRVVAVDQDGQMFRIAETYSTFAIDPKLEPKLFEIPD